MTRRGWGLAAAVAVLSGAAGFAFNMWRIAPEVDDADAAGALQATKLPDLGGRIQPLAQWRGRVVVVNFWATWCAPCREEIPLLVRLQDQYAARGLQLVGVAIDQADKVRPYAAEMRMNFPILIAGADTIELTRRLGNREAVLPFTVIIDRAGRIADRHVGAAQEGPLEAQLLALL